MNLSLSLPQLESSGVRAIRRTVEAEIRELEERTSFFQKIEDPQMDMVLTAKLRGELSALRRLHKAITTVEKQENSGYTEGE